MKYITKEKMSEVDKQAIDEFGITVEQLMENVGSNVARFISKFNPNRISILYGKGNNGGDGLSLAKHLSIMGFDIEIIPASDDLNKHAEKQLEILNKMNIENSNKIDKDTDLIVDALLGYNIKGNPKGKYRDLIKQANKIKSKKVAIDIPSGVDPDSGETYKPFFKTDYTLTLALPKKGMQKTDNFGELYLVNIGIPKELYKQLNLKVDNYFKDKDVVKI